MLKILLKSLVRLRKSSKRETSAHRVYIVLFFCGRVFPIYISLHLERVKGRTGGMTDKILLPLEGLMDYGREGKRERVTNLHICPRTLYLVQRLKTFFVCYHWTL